MRHALRRILWIVPTLFLVSIAAFWVLTATPTPGGRAEAGEHGAHPFFGPHSPPRFLNPHPTSVRELTEQAMNSIASDDTRAAAARVELARLGGAALPHLLPKLDSVEPIGRGRIALALAPIGQRMNVGTPEERGSPEGAALYWSRFWQDRAIDFRPAVVKRAVGRLAEKSTAGRRQDVTELDTFALPELIDMMAPVNRQADVKRATRMAAAASRITGEPWKVPKDASVDQARAVVRTWQRWWVKHRSDYVTFDGAGRALAMVSETQYAHWATDAVQNRLGTTASDERVLDVLVRRGPLTLWLLAVGLFAGFALGMLVGVAGAARARRGVDTLTSAVAVGIAALPIAALSAWAAPAQGSGARYFTAALLMTLAAAALTSRYQRASSRVAMDQEYSRTARAFGASPWRLARWTFRASSVASISLMGAHLAQLLTVAFVIEHALGLDGLAATTLRAIVAKDLAWLMALSLVIATALALVQITSDALLAALDPRVRLGFMRKRGAAE